MSGFIPDNRQISALQTGPGLVAKDPWFFRKHKRTADLAVSSASSLKRVEGAESLQSSLKRSFIVSVEGVSLFIVYSQGT